MINVHLGLLQSSTVSPEQEMNVHNLRQYYKNLLLLLLWKFLIM